MRDDLDLWVDFNEVDEDGHLVTLTQFARIDLTLGTFVLVGDHDGTTGKATVIGVEGELVTLSLHR